MTHAKHNIRRRYGGHKEKDVNPVDLGAISQTNSGVVRVRKGTVYIDFYKEDATKTTPFWTPVMVKDEYGNLVEMVRHSDADDVMVEGLYINNQDIQKRSDAEINVQYLRDL